MKFLKLSVFVALAGLYCTACEPTSLIQSSRQVGPYDINQPVDLIGDTSRSVHGEQNVLYSINNDNTNLYVTLLIADPKTQNKILHNGFTLWIDTTGTKKQVLGIAFPLPAKENKDVQSGSRKRGQSQDQDNITYQNREMLIEKKRRTILTMIEMDLIGFNGKVPLRIPAASNSQGISVALLVDSNGGLQYHAIIPFATLHYHPEIHTGKKAKPITIALTTNKPESKPYGEKGSHSSGGGGESPVGGGGMGGMGGGRGGHGGGGGGAAMDPANDPVDVWMHVKLSW